MKTTILHAIKNIIDYNLVNLDNYKSLIRYRTRVNNSGETLENMIKDALCGFFSLSEKEKLDKLNEFFSYAGNQNNPPDLIIRGGDALEIKKIESNEGSIALNSSFPKDKLYRSSDMLTNFCRNCEQDWKEKDLCYVIGCITKQQSLRSLWFIYGDCYCADSEIYTRLKKNIALTVKDLGIELSHTREIAKVKKVDPLGITDLRVRGMWNIKHPNKVFDYLGEVQSKPYLRALMLKQKFESFDVSLRKDLEQKCNIENVKIKNPNNPASLLQCILIEYIFIE